ncbi:MAG: VCBS repeat-containing protein [Candidatus Delongbacteria bacterium]|nr:VCBS repeat-containing protein [Candidatus Delongbacteria bacterium]
MKNVIVLFLSIFSLLMSQSFTEITSDGWGCSSLYRSFIILDLDNDGLLDLLNSDWVQPMDRWEQISPNSLELQLVERNFHDGLSTFYLPVFSDLDNDGLREMIYRSTYDNGTGNWVLEEENSINSLDFTIVSEHYDTGGGCGMSNFSDMNQNDLYDCIIIKHEDGVGYFYNIYEQQTPNTFDLHLIEEDIIPLNKYSCYIPQIIDIDNNGLYDIVIQDYMSDTLVVYRYEQTIESSFQLNLIDSNFLNLNSYLTSGSPICYGTSKLYCTDFNQNGKLNYIFLHPGDEERVFVLEQSNDDPNQFSLLDEIIVNFKDIIGANHSLIDLNNDNKLELFTTQNPTINLYEQDSLGSYQFELINEQFNEISEATIMKFYDLDNDGLMDLIIDDMVWEQSEIGSYDFEIVGEFTYDNIVVDFDCVTYDFADLNNDGVIDMVLGDQKGVVHFYIQSDENPYNFELTSTSFNSDAQASPRIIDLDSDGKYDLFLGTWNGKIRHLEQIDINSYEFEVIEDNFLNVNVGYNSSIDFSFVNDDDLLDAVLEGTAGYYLFIQNEDSDINTNSGLQAINYEIKHNNYPNPFNPSTTIAFNLPVADNVTVSIYNVNGQLIKTLINNQSLQSGNHTVVWNGKNESGSCFSSGMFIYSIKTKHGVVNKKILLVK